jgi:HD-like signal output (HDOD) protein
MQAVPAPASAPPFARASAPDEIVRQLRHLPSAPRVLPRLKHLLSDGNSSMHEVVAMIRLDPGIAARVLQMGNSAYYSQGLRCYTVDEAVHRVGYEQIYELVANAVASQVLVRPLAAYALEADELWRTSVACALAAELLAERLGADRDVAYTIGLLHGVGLVAIDEWAFRHQWSVRFTQRDWPLETCEAERMVLGFHNAEVGAALLRLWEFPPVMSEPVRWQYLPRGTAAHFQYAGLLHVAKWLRATVCGPGVAGSELPLPDAALLQRLDLAPRLLPTLTEQVHVRLSQVHSLLDIVVPEQATLPFPGAERSISSHPFARGIINRYA